MDSLGVLHACPVLVEANHRIPSGEVCALVPEGLAVCDVHHIDCHVVDLCEENVCRNRRHGHKDTIIIIISNFLFMI
ncbi:hypothetical protein [Methanobrevibacter sp.]|uniref:hypothetical protein n=1 Tax=Methanobrevibacter sp. TaxID=66852 RepID=UPI00257E6027|nr:hypothetical protein [Methanobrevibacter sp.]MBR2665195.1 hypothetical protein [Methanobrevibacter sp.]